MKVDKLFVAMKAFILFEGKALILKENKLNPDGTNAGKWDMPGGRLDPGESFKGALPREIKEETGLKVKIGRPFMVGEWWPKVRGEQWQVVATFWVCYTATDKVKLSLEHSEYQWVKLEDYKNINDFTNYSKQAFEEYLRLEKK